MTPAAYAHLRKVDPVLAAVMRRAGPCTLQPEKRRSPFEALVRSIAHQQLNGKAAATILGRFHALYPGTRYPTPDELAATSDDLLRSVGFSRNKVLALRDIAARTLDGTIPERRVVARLPDEAVIERLTQVRGVGRWTVEMLLMFTLGRPDVLPVDDFGVRNGFRLAYRKRQMPQPRVLAKFGERWAPYRSTAAWYLWRAVDLEREGRLPAKTPVAPLGKLGNRSTRGMN
jgi:DNA-3-methyladenine glycosylase II